MNLKRYCFPSLLFARESKVLIFSDSEDETERPVAVSKADSGAISRTSSDSVPQISPASFTDPEVNPGYELGKEVSSHWTIGERSVATPQRTSVLRLYRPPWLY